MTPEEVRAFIFGLIGSILVEAINVARAYDAGRPLAARYKQPIYLGVRLVVALGGGALAVAHRPASDLLSLHIGAATPAILQVLAAKPPE